MLSLLFFFQLVCFWSDLLWLEDLGPPSALAWELYQQEGQVEGQQQQDQAEGHHHHHLQEARQEARQEVHQEVHQVEEAHQVVGEGEEEDEEGEEEDVHHHHHHLHQRHLQIHQRHPQVEEEGEELCQADSEGNTHNQRFLSQRKPQSEVGR